MKLSFKIFLGICIPSIIVAVIISAIVINKNHETNLEAERQSITQNLRAIEGNLTSVGEMYGKQIIQLVSNRYAKKDIHILYYYNDVEFDNSEIIDSDTVAYDKILDSQYYVEEKVSNNSNYIIGTTKVSDGRYVIIEKNIDNIYKKRKELINNCLYILGMSLILIAFIAYVISKTLTRPLTRMQREMKKLSEGNFNINLKEGHDEFGKLAKNFNSMSKELERRNNELVESANNKQLFIDNLSHEMNTPLTSIQGYAELI